MKGQSLDGNNLDLGVLDQRVDEWKVNLDLIHQGSFPPPKFFITAAGVRFHDRSHLLVQDYLQRDSWDLQEEYGEVSLPSIYEETLTVFAAQLNHYANKSPEEFATEHNFRGILSLLHQIDYIQEGSLFLTDIHRISEDITKKVQTFISQPDFHLFRETLHAATTDTPGWDNTYRKG